MANDVPTAKCISTSLLYPANLNAKNNNGTIIIPPPAPNSPAKNPDKHPNAKSKKIIFISNIKFVLI